MPFPASRRIRAGAALGAAALLIGTSACGTGESAGTEGDRDLSIVASTTVYSSIAEAVAGDAATVTAIVSDPAADPHSFEATPADAADLTQADLVVYNGAGYDAFVDRSLGDAPDVPRVVAADLADVDTAGTDDHAGHDHDGQDGHDEDHDHDEGAPNEHVWMSPPVLAAVADEIASTLGELDPDGQGEFEDNARAFTERVTALEERLDDLAQEHAGARFVQSEDLGAYLFDAAELHDATPRTFLSAIHADSDPSARDYDTVQSLLADRAVSFFAYNSQTATPVTTRLADSARDADVPVVEVTEFPDESADVITWIDGMVDQLATALDDRPEP